MAQSRRVEKVASLIRRELSQLLMNGIRDDRVREGIVTITSVEVSGDLQHCKVFVSIYAEESQKNLVLDGLHSASGYLRGELGRMLHLRRAPEIVFYLDRGIEKGSAVLDLLEDLEKKRQITQSESDDLIES